MEQWFKQRMPSQEAMAQSRVLRPFARWIFQPELWRWRRDSVARGVALGVFFGFMIPLLQIFAAAIAAVFMRANIPIAAVSTLVTNPFTFPPVYMAAYQVGSLFLDHTPTGIEATGMFAGILNWLDRVGPPTVLGLFIFAVVGSITMYAVVQGAWRARISQRRRTPLKLRPRRAAANTPS
ncbi:MAG: DUF2062 domain-containing protein [Betaproteobacteria bacterium]|nr:DUF2062 domain-containing protein [Betaproteobacteria bacterium]